MASSKEKLRVSRANKKAIMAKRDETYVPSTQLVEPIAVEETTEVVKEKIKVTKRKQTALIPGEGRSMGMDLD